MTKNFTLAELTRTSTGLPNIPNEKQLERLKNTAECLELVRIAVGNLPIIITSCFRSPEVNEKVKGSDKSAHLDGDAADIRVASLDVFEVAKRIKNAGIKFDQLIIESYGDVDWVHISFAERMRNEVLRCINGKYTKWSIS